MIQIWVRSLRDRIEAIVGVRPIVMVSYMSGGAVDEWSLAIRFPKNNRYQYVKKEINQAGLPELMHEGNALADNRMFWVDDEEVVF